MLFSLVSLALAGDMLDAADIAASCDSSDNSQVCTAARAIMADRAAHPAPAVSAPTPPPTAPAVAKTSAAATHPVATALPTAEVPVGPPVTSLVRSMPVDPRIGFAGALGYASVDSQYGPNGEPAWSEANRLCWSVENVSSDAGYVVIIGRHVIRQQVDGRVLTAKVKGEPDFLASLGATVGPDGVARLPILPRHAEGYTCLSDLRGRYRMYLFVLDTMTGIYEYAGDEHGYRHDDYDLASMRGATKSKVGAPGRF